MKNQALLKVLVVVAVVLLAGLLGIILVVRVGKQAIDKGLAERNKVGFVVGATGVVFRSPNSELLAPAWNEPVIFADPLTFRTLFHSTAFCLGADAQTVFMGEGRCVYRLSDSQAATFRLLTPDGRFTCDAQNVYFMGFQLPKADPSSFKILGKFTSKDATHVFVGPLPMEGVDADTFELGSEGELMEPAAAYSEGPCTVRKYREAYLELKGFHGQDKDKRFFGPVRSKPNWVRR